jgi:alpha-galactosidase
MRFGLWVEPEMVNPDSDLYRAHPEWAVHFPSRTPTTARNQLVLNMARADVQAYLFEKIDALLSSCKIDFIKWDANRNISEPGWPDASGDPRELWVRYTQGVYSLWSRLRTRYPNIIWQACSGGGGRADLGILRQADQIWTSDNTDAVARLAIQDGFSQLFPACTMEAWVTDQVKERLSLDFRFHVAMCGTLGLGSHLLHWNRVERETAAHWIRVYKEIRPIVQLGDQYRLRPPRTSGFSALQYVSKDQTSAVLFAFRTHLPEPAWIAPLQLRGLDPEGLYEVEGFKTPRSGQAWMHTGLTLELRDFESTLRRIQRIG